ncbi:DUF2939 domain-containing protein [Croceicoccus sp. BE223]|uniref:DUF2939 domain-containing protein n=1 Tax=Croceicoccus sp. BE223 TaxID=2817716 RepID=UPI002856A546|nr:DUF2939 domain-containing protein [Croceicoccus sp. BE223]MDR7102137.1 hypothetical protein [Croceicoccus sp. BE223]
MKRLLALLFLTAVVAGGWFIGSRLYAVNDLASAAQSGDSARLERRVDFPAFRDSLNSEVDGAIERREIGGIGSVVAKASADFAIDRFVNPETIGQLVRTGQADGVGIAMRDDEREPVSWRIEGGDLNSFRVTGPDPCGALIFHRDGLGWRLAGIDLDG